MTGKLTLEGSYAVEIRKSYIQFLVHISDSQKVVIVYSEQKYANAGNNLLTPWGGLGRGGRLKRHRLFLGGCTCHPTVTATEAEVSPSPKPEGASHRIPPFRGSAPCLD